MPDKEGAEEKTTKSVVSKKQKQMMGEEGYDVARDMGRVKPSKDKKDATTMPPSKEMEKTRKVNKGPSALERVKANIEKKYGKGAIMNVKKEELDLTQVAESFGGYIIEMELDDPFGETKKDPKKDPTSRYDYDQLTGKQKEEYKKIKDEVKKSRGKITIGKGKEKNKPKQPPREKLTKGERLLAKKAGLDMSKIEAGIKPPTKAQSAAMQAARDMQQSGEKLTKDIKKGMQQIATGEVKDLTPRPYTPRSRRAKKAVYRDGLTKAERIAKVKKEIDAKNPTYIGKSGKPLPVKPPEPGMKGFRGVRKRTQRTAKKLGTKAFKAFKARPLATTIIGSELIDRVSSIAGRIPKPTPPKLDVGVVGRRTAG